MRARSSALTRVRESDFSEARLAIEKAELALDLATQIHTSTLDIISADIRRVEQKLRLSGIRVIESVDAEPVSGVSNGNRISWGPEYVLSQKRPPWRVLYHGVDANGPVRKPLINTPQSIRIMCHKFLAPLMERVSSRAVESDLLEKEQDHA